MRKHLIIGEKNNIKILALDDDITMALTIQAYFNSAGYEVDVENNPHRAIEKIRAGDYDILLLDYLMTPICGDKVVEIIRTFNLDLFIILLTGHKSLAPPVKTIRDLNIQGYYEKSDQFDQLELLVESCVKAIKQINTIRKYRDDLELVNMRLTESNHKLQTNYDDMVSTMRSLVDARDIYTRGHSDRVSFLARKTAKALGMSTEDCNRLKAIGLFHDVGKLKVPDYILLKDGFLDDHERLKIQEHPNYAVNILSNMEMLKEMIPGVQQHHERYDGQGYPNHISKNEICVDARIICVADSFDAMTSFRRYRTNMTVEQAAEEILKGKGTQFDPYIADVFVELLKDFDDFKNDKNWVSPILT